MPNHICAARMHTEDGARPSECNQFAHMDSERGLCYLHEKYAQGLCAPLESTYPEDSVTYMSHAVTGEAWAFTTKKGGDNAIVGDIRAA